MTKEIQEIIKAASLVRIDLHACSSNIHVHPALIEPQKVRLNIERNVEWRMIENNQGLVCSVATVVTGEGGVGAAHFVEGQPVFNLSCTYNVLYKMDGTNFSAEALTWFANNNASFNVHSYAREFFDVLSRKMGISPVILPLLKPERPEKKEEQKVLSAEKNN